MRRQLKFVAAIFLGWAWLLFPLRADAQEPAFSVGYIQGMLDVPVSTIRKLGLEKKHGLNVEFKRFGDPDSINDAFMLKRITIQPGMNVLVSGNRKAQTGYGLAVFPTFQASNKLIVKADSPVRSVADLRGKRIAVNSTTGGEFLVLKWTMKTDHGMDIMKDVDPRPVPPPVAIQLLNQGDVAAALMFEPFATRTMFGGKGREIWDIQEEWQRRKGQPLWFSAIHVDDSFARAHSDVLKRYLRVYSEAVDYINKNPLTTYQRYREAFKIQDEADFQLLLKHHTGIFSTKWDDSVIGSIKEYMQLAVEEKILPRMVNELFSKDYVP